MTTSRIKFETVEQYIASFPADVQQKLETLRTAFKQAVPEAAELIHYQMPALDYHGKLVYFAAFKNHYHITFPHAGKVFGAFKDELPGLDISKSSIRLPANKPLPLDLLTRMTKFKADELKGK
ncbi:iron chaperone [Mucilaginibacter sp.]|jgi:uncharacterized protein YdhG (YjbR/CyaY superfamily)|uniref:iron chaperone n=1 Tax=Mucilaginibacter sp. TaxID=1882438 RepID=UPI002BC1717B|nr:DUF1801 domain-containing protein [Mucilaginibacter sp.]HTI58051.1 DUF1801 domain-containing protein [Mucilaginibacter sp.]